MKFVDNADIDGSFKALGGNLPCTTKKTITFAGGTADAWGNDGGALDGGVIFTVTGVVEIKVLGVCRSDLTGANATFEVGIAGATAIFGAQLTATNLDLDEFHLNNATPAKYSIIGEEEAAADNFPLYLLNGQDIIGTVTTANITGGVVDYYAFWRPRSSDAKVVAA